MTDGSRLIAQRYRLDAPVGVGGMGEVWRATDQELRRTVALKKSQAGDSAQIRREARIGAGLHHPHVVTVFDAVTDGADRWLVMEYLPSRNLGEVLRTDGPLHPVTAARVVGQIADAVAAMHAKGMVHRDIKPGNVLVAEDGTAKLTDLGIARWAEVTRTSDTQGSGTPGYVAPEVADGAEADARADVFALGATLFAAATGQSPWGSGEQGPFVQLHRARNYQLEPLPDNELTAPLRALLARDPAARPTAAQAHLGLATLADGAAPPVIPLGSGPVAGGSAGPSRITRRAQLAAAIAVGLLLVVAGIVFLRPPPAVLGMAAPVPAPPQPGAILDPRTMDPCSVLDRASLSSYGKVYLNRDYGGFNICDLQVARPDDSVLHATAEFENWDETYLRPTPGKINGPDRRDEQDDHCKRIFTMPDKHVLILDISVQNGSAHLCPIADRVTTPASLVLSQGAIPRLPTPRQPWSLAFRNACSLLDPAALTAAIGTAPQGEPAIGNWLCDWGEDDGKQVEIVFNQDWNLEDPDQDYGADGPPIQLSDRTGYKVPDDGACEVEFATHSYTITDPPPGSKPGREETVKVYLIDPDAKDPESLCPGAAKLADAVIRNL